MTITRMLLFLGLLTPKRLMEQTTSQILQPEHLSGRTVNLLDTKILLVPYYKFVLAILLKKQSLSMNFNPELRIGSTPIFSQFACLTLKTLCPILA